MQYYYAIDPIRASKIIATLRWRQSQGIDTSNKGMARDTCIPEAAIRAAKLFYKWGKTMKWPIARIRRDGGTQSRAFVPEEWPKEYAERIKSGEVLPPVDLFHDGEDYFVGDGFIRIRAHELLGLTHVEAMIHQGTQRDAQLFSFAANHKHGHKRTEEDLERAITAMLMDPEWGKWSDRQIAQRCKTYQVKVSRLRKQLIHRNNVSVNQDSPVKYINGHGQEAVMSINPQEVNVKIREILNSPDASEMTERDIAKACGTNQSRVRRVKQQMEEAAAVASDEDETAESPDLTAWVDEIAVETRAFNDLHDDRIAPLKEEIEFYQNVAYQIAELRGRVSVAMSQYRPLGPEGKRDARPLGPYAAMIHALLKASNPKQWKACEACANELGLSKGQIDGSDCPACRGFGFVLND